jgi:hypothetical protein
LQQARKTFRLAKCNQEARFGVAQNACLPRCVFRNAIGAKRRIDRHRNSASEQDACKRIEKVGAGGQHDGHRLSGFKSSLQQFSGNGRSAAMEFAEGNRAQVLVFFVQLDVGAFRFAQAAQPQNFRQGLGGPYLLFQIRARRQCRRNPSGDRTGRVRATGRCSGIAKEGFHKVFDGIGFGYHTIGQSRAADSAQADHQFDALEAAQPEVTLEVRRAAARR